MTVDELRASLISKRNLNSAVISEFNELRRNRDLLESIRSRFSFIDSSNVGQLLYHLRDDLEPQLCRCGAQRNFRKFDKGYSVTCGSASCKTESRLENLKKNTFEKYGVEHTSQLESTKEKHKKTMLEKYGAAHNFSGKLREKAYATNLSKYGVEHALQSKELVEKRRNTMIERHGTLDMLHSEKSKSTNVERYGDTNPIRSDSVKQKIRTATQRTRLAQQASKLDKFGISIVRYISERQYYDVICTRCSTAQTLAGCTLNAKLRMDTDPCRVCNPYVPSYSSELEKELVAWLQSLGEKVLSSVKTLVTGSELDILLPDRGIGFEFNGLYWHSEIYKEADYHYEKSFAFLQKGVKIYHVWEDDWLVKKRKVKSRILSLLKKNDRIAARKCSIEKIDGTVAKRFFIENHLDDSFNAKFCLGAFYEGELVSVMSFSKSRFDGVPGWEIIRFANLTGKTVVGIADRLVKRFIELESPARLVSYAKIDWTPDPTTAVYSKIGFVLESMTPPTKYWVVDGLRMHRLNFTKKKLVEQGNDPTLTADEIMHSKKRYCAFDAGNWKFVLNISG